METCKVTNKNMLNKMRSMNQGMKRGKFIVHHKAYRNNIVEFRIPPHTRLSTIEISDDMRDDDDQEWKEMENKRVNQTSLQRPK